MDTFGRNYRVSVFGESHGNAIGVLLDGVPAGIGLSEQDFLADIDRRRSGAKGTTPRKETDMPEILSGVYEGHTTGAPLALIFRNGNTRSHDYDRFRDVPRPGHADFVAGLKWKGFNDPRGGGHFSGRLTLPFVAAGVVAKRILTAAGILKSGDGIRAGLAEVGGISANEPEYLSLWDDALDKAAAEGDSLGGIVRCVIEGLPAGIGEPFFCSVESMISQAVFSIPGVRGIEFGDGFASAGMRGSQHNDVFVSGDGKCASNGAGGINGGITNGNPLIFRVAFKPTSSIRRSQHTFDFSQGKMTDLEVPGRHDVCFALRTPVIVEAAAAIALADLALCASSPAAAVDFPSGTSDKF